MSKSVADLRLIAASGGGMILDGASFSTADLRLIAASASGKGAQILLRNASSKSTADLRLIAASGGGCVAFDFMT